MLLGNNQAGSDSEIVSVTVLRQPVADPFIIIATHYCPVKVLGNCCNASKFNRL